MYWASLGIFKVHIKQIRQTYDSASACRIFSKSDHPRQNYDVISFSRWRPRHRNSTSPFGFCDFAHPRRSKSIPAYQISAKYSNRRLIYYYFRFLKINVRHAGIVLPVPVLPERDYVTFAVAIPYVVCLSVCRL